MTLFLKQEDIDTESFGYIYTCDSTETLSMYQQELEKAGTTSDYPNTTFTIVSADNIDFLHAQLRECVQW